MSASFRFLPALLCFILLGCKDKPVAAQVVGAGSQKTERQAPEWQKATQLRYEVVKELPHDPDAFTQGLEIHKGQWLESTGLVGKSSIRRVDPASGKPLILKPLVGEFFGEGLTEINGLVYQLTWQHSKGFIYDANTLEWKKNFQYPGEGWGICNDGVSLYMSDGSSRLRIIDPATMNTRRMLSVTWNNAPLEKLNELEYIEGEIFSNIWGSDQIARINPETGNVIGMIDFSGIDKAYPRKSTDHVLNGIAYDESTGLLYVTGKCWPKIFEVRLLPK